MDPNSLNTVVEYLRIDATTLYYTYSTIAQTLAGAFGILGAFILFRLQSLDQSIKGICTAIFKAASKHTDKIKQLFAQENWDDFLQEIEGYSWNVTDRGTVLINGVQFKNYRKLLRGKINLKKNTILNLKVTLCLTAVTIALSLILLPLTPILAQRIYFSIGFLTIVIFLSILCIYKYMRLIIEALKSDIVKKTKDEQKQ